MQTPRNPYEYPCWADFERRYCESFARWEGCKYMHNCKAYKLGHSVSLEDDPEVNPYWEGTDNFDNEPPVEDEGGEYAPVEEMVYNDL